MSRNTGVPARTLNDWKLKHFEDMPGEDEPVDDKSLVAELVSYLTSRPIPKPTSFLQSVCPKKQYGSVLLGGDWHYPYHHLGATRVVQTLLDKWKPDIFIFNGDLHDFAALSTFPKNPNALAPLQRMLDEGAQLMADFIGISPETKFIFVPGNHEEDRLLRYIWTHCPDLASLRDLRLEHLMQLSELGVAYAPDGVDLTPELVVQHGERFSNVLGGGSAQSARKEGLDLGVSSVTSHTHHGGMFYRRDRRGYRVNAEAFCLCDQDAMRKAGVMRRKRGGKVEDWTLGCMRIDYHVGGDSFCITPIPIIEKGNETFTIVMGERIAA
jgi:hypothetical protein